MIANKPVAQKLDVSILYVEDEIDIRDAVSEMLHRKVTTLYLAENGKMGLDIFKEKSPDIVITDIKMPIMDGLEMAKEIKNINKNTPIIVTTAHEEKDFFLKSIEIGIHSYVVKPIDRIRLKEAIENIAYKLEIERKVLEQNQCINSLINLQDDIIIIIESKYLKLVNKAFLDFFGFNDSEEFNEKYSSVIDFFKEKKEHIYKPKENGSNWLEYLLTIDENANNANQDGTIYLKDSFKYLHSEFVVKFEVLPNSDKFIVIMKKIKNE